MNFSIRSFLTPVGARRFVRACALRLVFALALSPSAASADEPLDGLFRPLAFPAALETATREQKLVLVDFHATWCGPCRLLDQTTWQDAKVVARVAPTAVAIKVDVDRERDLAKRFKIEAMPTILLLAADGTERDRYVGYLAPAAFLAKYDATLAGRSSVAAARDTVKAKGAKDPKARLELARGLANQENGGAEALEHFLWCYDAGVAADARFASQRNRIPGMIASLGRKYPAALDALRERRAAQWTNLSRPGAKPTTKDCEQLGHLDAALRDEALILDAVTAFKPNASALKAYGEPVQSRLVDMKRYAEALAVSDVEPELAKMEQMLERVESTGSMSPRQLADLKRKAAKEGALPLEMLAGAGETARAKDLLRRLLAWDDSAAVREVLAKRLVRAGATELAAEVGAGKK